MALGLRFRAWSQSLGTAFDWLVPDEDMPDASNKRGYKVFRDELTTKRGNTWLYDGGRVKEWQLKFLDISTTTKERLEFLESGWLGSRQIVTVYWGSSVPAGTNTTVGSIASVGQCWGTGYVSLNSLPEESDTDLWNVEMTIKEFGPDQSFT